MTDHAGKTEKDYPFRFAERCLYDYLENVARLEALRAELRALDSLSSAGSPKYDGMPTTGYPRDAVSARLERIEIVEQDILGLERRTLPIRRLYDDLGSPYVLEDSPKRELLEILRLKYFGENTWKRLQIVLSMSEQTLRRKRKDLVTLAAGYLALK